MATIDFEQQKTANRTASFKTAAWLGYTFTCVGLASKFAMANSLMSYETAIQFGRVYFFASWIGLLVAMVSIVIGDLAKLRHADAPYHYLVAWFGLAVPLAMFIYDYASGIPIWWYLVRS